jgi:hypothetical protein
MRKRWQDASIEERYAMIHKPADPPPAPVVSLPPMELSEDGARERKRLQAAREIELAMRAEAEAKPRPLDLSFGTIFSGR